MERKSDFVNLFESLGIWSLQAPKIDFFKKQKQHLFFPIIIIYSFVSGWLSLHSLKDKKWQQFTV